MSTHPNIDKICVVVLLFTLLLTILFINGERLGIEVIIDEDAENHSGSVYFTENDLNGSWDTSSATIIHLDGSSAHISGSGAYFYNGNLVISAAGKYVLSGILEDGCIVVDAHRTSKVWLLMDGVEISNIDDACLRVEQAEKVFVTLAEGSENRLASGEYYSAEALAGKRGGAIFARDDLTINGSGSLEINSGYKHGIDANDDVVLAGGSISITAAGDAVHVKESLRIRETVLTAETEDDGLVVKNTDGYLYIESGVLSLTAEGDAIHTTGEVTVAGGNLTINAGDDAIHSETAIRIEDGTVFVGACYEGMEAQTIHISGGEITIYPKDDGLNANGGTDLFGLQGFGHDGWKPGETVGEQNTQPVSSMAPEEKPLIAVSGGSLTIINPAARDADGMDSNGDILISGGIIRISIVDGGTNNAIDYGSESGGVCEITGGDVIACGGSGMAEEISGSSSQCSVFYYLSESAPDESLVSLQDKEGKTLAEWEVPCSFSSVVISCPEMAVGEACLLTIGEFSEEITPEETAGTFGKTQGIMFGGMGGHGGPGFNGDQMQSFDGERPERPFFDGNRPEPPFEGEIQPGMPPFLQPDNRFGEEAENLFGEEAKN